MFSHDLGPAPTSTQLSMSGIYKEEPFRNLMAFYHLFAAFCYVIFDNELKLF